MSAVLGRNQLIVLRTMAGGLMDGGERPYPGGGWEVTNRSTTLAILESLERRRLVERRRRPGAPTNQPVSSCAAVWCLTAAGREAASPRKPTTPAVGTAARAVRGGRTYATGTLRKVYDAPAGPMAQIDEGTVSGPAGLPTVTIVPVEDITEDTP